MSQPGKSIGGQAVYWGISEPTVKRERLKGTPLHSVEETAAWAESHSVPAAVREKIKRERRAAAPPAALPTDSPDWIEFEKATRADDPKESMVKIARARDFAAFMFQKAARMADKENQEFYTDLLAKMESCLHDAQLRAKKLGIDAGELLPRPEVERLVWALMYWLLRSTDHHLDALTTKLQALSPGLPAEAVRGILDAELISNRCLIPFARAAKIRSGVTVPDWVVQKMRTTAGDFIENGEASFTELQS